MPVFESRKHWKAFEITGQQLISCWATKPTADYSGIDAAKIRGENEVVAFVQVSQASWAPIVSAMNLLADNIHMVCSSMIGAETGILRHAAPEFREYEYGNVVGTADAIHILHKALDCIRNVSKKSLMQIRLLYVSVKGVVTV